MLRLRDQSGLGLSAGWAVRSLTWTNIVVVPPVESQSQAAGNTAGHAPGSHRPRTAKTCQSDWARPANSMRARHFRPHRAGKRLLARLRWPQPADAWKKQSRLEKRDSVID